MGLWRTTGGQHGPFTSEAEPLDVNIMAEGQTELCGSALSYFSTESKDLWADGAPIGKCERM